MVRSTNKSTVNSNEISYLEIDMIEGFEHPRQCKNLVGHTDIEQRLHKMLNDNKLPHALIFSGIKGIGKATMAFKLTRYLLENPKLARDDKGNNDNMFDIFDLNEGKEDGNNDEIGGGIVASQHLLDTDFESISNRQLLALSHPDLLYIRREYDLTSKKFKKNISVENIRKINQFFNLTSAYDGWQICIIDSVDDMNINSANALLKILEEPPENSLFILINHNRSFLLPTILSRCQNILFNPLNGDELQKILEDKLESSIYNLSDDELRDINKISANSIGKSLEIISYNGLHYYNELKTSLNNLDSLDYQNLIKLATSLNSVNKKNELNLFMNMLKNILAQSISAANSSDEEVRREDKYNGDFNKLIQFISSSGEHDQWAKSWQKINELEFENHRLNLTLKQLILNSFFILKDLIKKG